MTCGTDGSIATGFSAGNFGSLAPNEVFNDSGGTARTIDGAFTIGSPAPPGSPEDSFVFSLTSAAPDSAASFVNIIANGDSYPRSTGTYTPSGPSGVAWVWPTISPLPSSGPITLDVEFE